MPAPAERELQLLASGARTATHSSVRPLGLIRSRENRCVCSGSGRRGRVLAHALLCSASLLASSRGEFLGRCLEPGGSGVRTCQKRAEARFHRLDFGLLRDT